MSEHDALALGETKARARIEERARRATRLATYMRDDAMRDLCVKNPPSIVKNDDRYQLDRPHQGFAETMRGLGHDVSDVPTMPVWHLDGVDWHDHTPPRRGHKHWAQTVGQLMLFEETWRCPCGAIAHNGRWSLLDKPRVTGPGILPAARVRVLRPLVFYPVAALVVAVLLDLVVQSVAGPLVAAVVGMPLGLLLGVVGTLYGRHRERTTR